MNNIYFAGDHHSLWLKAFLCEICAQYSKKAIDLGPNNNDMVDYPDFADKLCQAMQGNDDAFGVLICGSGVGMSMVANRYRHIRAVLCHDMTIAKLSRQHNNANILVLGANLMGKILAQDIFDVFINTPFDGGRHQARIDKFSV